jgi:hypothetical protein
MFLVKRPSELLSPNNRPVLMTVTDVYNFTDVYCKSHLTHAGEYEGECGREGVRGQYGSSDCKPDRTTYSSKPS